jgi:hypothetical protein
MKARVRALRRASDSPLVAVLKTLGCLYAWPEHREHASIFDAHTHESFPAAPVELTGELEEISA